MKKLTNLTRFSLLLALGIILGYVDSMLSYLIPLPGIKLGLSHFVGLLIIYLFSFKEFILYSFLKVFLVALITTGFSLTFLISLGGLIISLIAITLIYYLTKSSIYSLSIFSSVFHGLGQIITVVLIYKNIYFLMYLPFLLIINVLTGLLIAIITKKIITRVNSTKILENTTCKNC